jgi:hypothetical protein
LSCMPHAGPDPVAMCTGSYSYCHVHSCPCYMQSLGAGRAALQSCRPAHTMQSMQRRLSRLTCSSVTWSRLAGKLWFWWAPGCQAAPALFGARVASHMALLLELAVTSISPGLAAAMCLPRCQGFAPFYLLLSRTA